MLALVGIVVLLASFIVRFSIQKNTGKKARYIPILGFIVCFGTIILSSVTIIPTGNTGVKTRFGQISKDVVPTGINFTIPFVEKVEIVSNKKQDISIDDQIWGESSDKVQVYGSQFQITYQINPEYSAMLYSSVSDYRNSLINSYMVASSFKDAASNLSSKEVTVRGKVEPLTFEILQEKINEKYGENAIIINQVLINDMNFEESYNQSILDKNQAEITYEQSQISNRTAIEKAEADKVVAETNAKSQAESKLILAKAEAEANAILAASLTPEILQQMEMEARLKHGWVTVNSGGSVIAQP